MNISIPPAGGVPGISGPPDWFSAPAAGGNVNLDDVRWTGATLRTFGGGTAHPASFRAAQAGPPANPDIYLSFRAAFVPALSDQYDDVYLGLQKTGSAEAIVIRLRVHGPLPVPPTGPPSATAPVPPVGVAIWTTPGTPWHAVGTLPTWLEPATTDARVWRETAPPNIRWAIQIHIPNNPAAASITDNNGPNLGANFSMWYLIRGSLTSFSPDYLADTRTSGTTTDLALTNGNFPLPSLWDQYALTSGPAANGGVLIKGNGFSDIVVRNKRTGPDTESTTIWNHHDNTFVARPRNYTATAIPPGDISATFRIANWGSVAGDPSQANFATGTWDYLPGNSATNPVISTAPQIELLSAVGSPPGNPPPDPPTTNNQLQLSVTPLDLDVIAAGKSLHQCILVTLSSINLIFLNDSAFQNMYFDSASLLEPEAEISIVGLAPFSPQPRDVYLAIEKVNMLRNTPAGTNEGRFLNSSISRLIAQGGPLAEKLARVRSRLSNAGDYGSAARLEAMLSSLRDSLAALEYRDREQGRATLDRLIDALNRWLSAVKGNEGAAKRLAALFDVLAGWLLADGLDAMAKLAAFVGQLNQWLSGLANDQASSQLLPPMVQALQMWLSTLVGGDKFTGPIQTSERWLSSGRPTAQLPALLNALRELLTSLSSSRNELKPVLATFSDDIARWLKGSERLDRFVNELADAGLTTEEIDQFFPSFRVHVYHDTGERVTGSDGQPHPVVSVQSSFGLYAYHEGSLDGWQTSLQGAQRIADNLYLLAVPNNGTSKVTVRVQAVAPGEERIPEDPIKREEPCGCLCQILTVLKAVVKAIRTAIGSRP